MQWPHYRRNTGGEPKQQLGLGPKRIEEVLAALGQQPGRQTQAFQRYGRAKATVVGAVHGAEAAFGDDRLDVIRRGDHRADDAERVFCHLCSAAARLVYGRLGHA